MGKVLVALDFDHTVINANSDTWVYRALPNGVLPAEIKAKHVSGQWTAFMSEVLLHAADAGVSPSRVLSTLDEVPLTPGMPELLDHLARHPGAFDVIIVSDANSLFIDRILSAQPGGDMRDMFAGVFTNPATCTPEPGSRIEVRPYHDHDCPRCVMTPNLCKSKVIREFRQQKRAVGIEYGRVLFVGDGANDFCPCTSLSEQDVVFPRQGFPLHKQLQQEWEQDAEDGRGGGAGVAGQDRAAALQAVEEGAGRDRVVAEVVVWESGLQVLQWVQASVTV